ncbi:MAG: dienelactone hydrolase family protein [Planctomycetaceae bacterium]|nr:dienelactone hydrolase family protein [Planctomycetaceae bacterium]
MKTFAALALLLPALLQDPVKDRLDQSPRHHEWVQIKVGDRTLHAFVVFPEVKEKAPAVVVIHENKGLSDWVRSAADQFAEAGVIAIAPDHLSGLGPNGGKTSDFPTVDAATQALYKLPPDQVSADLNACADYVAKLDACNGKVAAGGFCWGGGQTFRFATNRESLAAALVFYGPAPEDKAALAKIKCPVYGFYGENDARINAGIEKTTASMKEAGKTYDPVIYKGAGHGFMRAGETTGAKDDEKKARADAWARIRDILKKL